MKPWPLILTALKAPFVRLPSWMVWTMSLAFVCSGLCLLAYFIGYAVGFDEGRYARRERDSAGDAWRLVVTLEPLRQGNTQEATARTEYLLQRAILHHADFLEKSRPGLLPAADEIAMSNVARYLKSYPWTAHELTKMSVEDQQRIRRVLDRYEN